VARGAEVEHIRLRDVSMETCTGCLECEETGECIFDDEFNNSIIPQIKGCDLLILATPVYFNMPTSKMKAFIERTNPICEFLSENPKRAAIFLVGQADLQSIESAEKCLREYCEIMGMVVCDDTIKFIEREPGAIVCDDQLKERVCSWLVD